MTTRFKAWRAKRAEERAAREASEEARRNEQKEKLLADFKEYVDQMSASGFTRAINNVHRANDSSTAGGYFIGPNNEVYLLTVHQQGAAHIKKI